MMAQSIIHPLYAIKTINAAAKRPSHSTLRPVLSYIFIIYHILSKYGFVLKSRLLCPRILSLFCSTSFAIKSILCQFHCLPHTLFSTRSFSTAFYSILDTCSPIKSGIKIHFVLLFVIQYSANISCLLPLFFFPPAICIFKCPKNQKDAISSHGFCTLPEACPLILSDSMICILPKSHNLLRFSYQCAGQNSNDSRHPNKCMHNFFNLLRIQITHYLPRARYSKCHCHQTASQNQEHLRPQHAI